MKPKVLAWITAVLVLLLGGLSLFGSTLVPPLYTISSKILLPASPQQSWEILTDFARYPEWNPYLPRVEGPLEPGEIVSFTLVDGNFPEPMELSARVAEVRPNEEFYWIGTAGIRGIHDTRHVFRLVLREDGSTELLHFEEFRGALPALLPGREERIAHTQRAFEAMNTALQERLRSAEPGEPQQ